MKDSNDVEQVRSKVLELESALRNFYEAHDKYHAVLIDDNDIQESIEYCETVKHAGTAVIQTFDVWFKSVESKLQEELDLAISLHPEDSVSSSRVSQSSTASSARLKASTKKAALSVEAAALKIAKICKWRHCC